MRKTTASNPSSKTVFKCISCEKLESDLAQAREEIAKLKDQIKINNAIDKENYNRHFVRADKLEVERDRLQQQNDKYREENEKLKKEIDGLRKH